MSNASTVPPITNANSMPTPRVQFSTTGPSLTKQSHMKECDINLIMAKWEKTGILEHRNTHEGSYGDFTSAPGDYQESLNAVLDAETMFSELPSKIRRRFGNDPGQFLDFVQDPDNADEMVSLGLSDGPSKDEVLEDPPTPPKPAKTAPTPPPEPEPKK